MSEPAPIRQLSHELLSTPPNLSVEVATGDALDVRRFRVDERLSTLFEIRLEVVSQNHALSLDDIVGGRATFTIRGGTHGVDRVLTGVCRDLAQRRAEPGGLSHYQLTLVPALWLLTQRRNYRMFQQQSEIAIVRALLSEWGIPHRLELGGVYPPREYRVQYGESDFDFLSRMLEDVGVSYWFVEGDGGTELVLGDAPQATPSQATPIPFSDQPTATRRDLITKASLRQQVTPGGFTLRDYDTRLASDFPLFAGAKAGAASIEARLEQFVYTPGALLTAGGVAGETPSADDRSAARSNLPFASELAQKRLDAARQARLVLELETSAHQLGPGVVFTMSEHPRPDLAADFLIVASSHEGAHNETWTHRCEARPTTLAFRPPLVTPRPRVGGVETATVVGPAGEEIHVDEFGRVRVHFHWDRESQRDERSSTWLPVSQPWGGSGYGGTNLPRIGQEVVVDFLGGDPDRPVITGRLYTNLQRTPYKLPDLKTQSGWKSCSTQQTGGYNEIMFEDAAGRELVRMQAERDLDKLVKHDERVVIGRDRTKEVRRDDRLTVVHDRNKEVQHDEATQIGNDRSEQVGRDETIAIGNDRSEQVGRDEDLVIGNDRDKLVQQNEREVVGVSRTRFVGVNEAVLVGVAQQIAVGIDQSTKVGKNRSVDVGADQTTTVGKNTRTTIGKDLSTQVGGSEDRAVSGSQSIKIAKTASEMVGMAKTVTVGAALQTSVGAVMNTSVGLSSSEQVGIAKSIVAGASISLVCGRSSLTLEASGKISLAIDGGASVVLDDKNATVTAPGGGSVVLIGGPDVHLNP